ncbi:glycerol-3-phosphate dehydrogenase/oxidase [Hydrogenophaga sp. ZJX-1]|uniref:glycerol-3-phosphate dehydrogenase/oxidase n=1 Tax=Hydrogenophaga sp. ZJX-1 TaxID=3404778 RepID=UPI003B27F71C
MRSRDVLLKQLKAEPSVDVLIVGGGINGVGLLRDLAAQGVGAVLVDRADFCSGTSAAPSRLIHGGLRYLETGEFALVRESVEERNRLLGNAPHLVVPMPVWVPLSSWFDGLLTAPARFFGWTRTPGSKGALVTKIGLVFYDWFGRLIGNVPRHRLVRGAPMRQAMPSIAKSVKLAAEYFDARLVHPERLTLELIADAEEDCPAAMALPYVALETQRGGEVHLRDQLTGASFGVRPKLVINTAGAWVDEVGQGLGQNHKLIGGTRGSHLVLRHLALARELGPRMIYFETADHRICLAYCIAEDLVLLGTTDIRTNDPDDNRCTQAEIDYLFKVLKEIMPAIVVGREHMVFTYSGVRPLPNEEGVVAGAISRDHSIREWPAEEGRPYDVITLVGGKWTTYRACAAQIADRVLQRQGKSRVKDTDDLPIGGGRDWPTSDAQMQAHIASLQTLVKLDTRVLALLCERYGVACEDVASLVAEDGATPITDLPDYFSGEMRYMAQQQRICHLADVVLRRTLLAIEGRCTQPALRMMAAVIGEELGWDGERQAQEVADTMGLLLQRHGVSVP